MLINEEAAVQTSPLEEEDKVLTKDEHVVNYVKVLIEIDKAMEPFKEHRHEVKQMYKDNHWLTKEEMTLAAKAYRTLKNDEDLQEVIDYVNKISTKVNI